MNWTIETVKKLKKESSEGKNNFYSKNLQYPHTIIIIIIIIIIIVIIIIIIIIFIIINFLFLFIFWDSFSWDLSFT